MFLTEKALRGYAGKMGKEGYRFVGQEEGRFRTKYYFMDMNGDVKSAGKVNKWLSLPTDIEPLRIRSTLREHPEKSVVHDYAAAIIRHEGLDDGSFDLMSRTEQKRLMARINHSLAYVQEQGLGIRELTDSAIPSLAGECRVNLKNLPAVLRVLAEGAKAMGPGPNEYGGDNYFDRVASAFNRDPWIWETGILKGMVPPPAYVDDLTDL